jgi:hypothetical protein
MTGTELADEIVAFADRIADMQIYNTFVFTWNISWPLACSVRHGYVDKLSYTGFDALTELVFAIREGAAL